MGLRHPLQHLRGSAIRALRSENLQVDVVGEELQSKLIEVRGSWEHYLACLLLEMCPSYSVLLGIFPFCLFFFFFS